MQREIPWAESSLQGNVYDMSSLQMLAIKTKTMRDLVTEEAFTRKDIITIQVSLFESFFRVEWLNRRNRIRRTWEHEISRTTITSRAKRRSKV
jgi:hypothetical protein